jgi:hypothetical protein
MRRYWLPSIASTLVFALMAPVGSAADPVPCNTSAGACWVPPVGARWQYQLEARSRRYDATGGINVDLCVRPFGGGPCVSPEVYDIDLYVDERISGEGNFVVNTAAVNAIHARGRHAICYVSAGTVERFRPDYQAFVDFDTACGGCLIGNPFSARFPDEFWANINDDQGQRTFMLQMLEARVQQCDAAGFDGVELDVVDAYAQGTAVTGWDISAATQLAYNQALANMVHGYGLTVALKNDIGQRGELMPYFDYAINEQCFQYDECDTDPSPGYAAWIAAGKAVFTVEYRGSRRRFCPLANAAGYSTIKKSGNFSLRDRPYRVCQ